MAQCCSSYLVPEKVLSLNPLVSRWKALSQSLVGTTSLIPIWYHKSLEFKPRKWKHNYIMCHKALLVDITIPIPIWYHKSWVSNPLTSTWKKTLLCPLPQGLTWCHILYHKAWLEVQRTACESILLVCSKRKRKTLDAQSRFFFSNLKKFYLPINHDHMHKKHMKF